MDYDADYGGNDTEVEAFETMGREISFVFRSAIRRRTVESRFLSLEAFLAMERLIFDSIIQSVSLIAVSKERLYMEEGKINLQ